MKTRIIVDSTCDLMQAQKERVHIVPCISAMKSTSTA